MHKKIRFTLLTLFCFFPALLSASEIVRLTRYVGENLTGVYASYLFQVELIADTETKAIVDLPLNLERYLVFEKTENGVVRVGMQFPKNMSNQQQRQIEKQLQSDKLLLKLYTPKLEYIRLGSVAKAIASGNFYSEKTEIKLGSVSKLTGLKLKTKQLYIEMSGTSGASLDISAGESQIKLSGTSKLTLSLKDNKKTIVTQSGTSKSNLTIPENEEMTISTSGTSGVTLNGRGGGLKVSTSGTSKVSCRNFLAKQAEVVSSGVSHVSVYASEYLKIKTSSSAKVQYTGDPKEKDIATPNVSEIQ